MRFFLVGKKERYIVYVAGVCVLLFIVCFLLRSFGVIAISKSNRLLPIYKVSTSDNKLAISFDACWGDETLKHNDIIMEWLAKGGNYYALG